MITPAVFEDETKKIKTLKEGVDLMTETLVSLGYEAGIRVYEGMDDDIVRNAGIH